MFRAPLFFALSVFTFSAFAQNSVPDFGQVFRDDVVPRVDILIAQDLLDEILAPGNESSNTEHPATFIFDNGEIRDTVEMIGFRLRGNTSRSSAKKSFKVAFDSFEDGRDYKGLEKINLNGEHNDPSIIRSKISWDLLRDMGVPGPRSNHVELYINEVYYGLYMNIEQIDEEFAESRFGDKDGNLFKCLWPADLNFRGPDGADYKHSSGSRRVYNLQTNKSEDNYDNLANFIDVLNNTPTNTLMETLEPIFNVNAYLKNLAVEVIIGQWDGYAYNKNNYYLYENPITDKIEYIHFDLDNTIGIDFLNRDWGIRNVYSWKKTSELRPLFSRIMEIQTYRDRYTYYLRELLENYYKPEVLNPKIDIIKSMIQTSAEADNFRTLDWGFSIDDFNSSYDMSLGGHVSYGLKEFIQVRYNSALSQLETIDLAPIIWSITNTKVIVGEPLTFSVRVEDDNDFGVSLNYQLNGQSIQTIAMLDDGLNGDKEAGDGIYSTQLDGLNPPASLEYYVTAEDISDNISREPLIGNLEITISDADAVPLFINEYMASNDITIADEAGEFDDWFEIYNAGSNDIFLGDKFLSDNFLRPDKWKMPDLSIGPGEHILVWADNDEDQGPFHTNFKLSKDGDEIGIFYGEEFGFLTIHSVVYGPQETDISEGLLPDGMEPFEVLSFATPGRSNIVTGVNSPEFFQSITIWPNPISNMIYVMRQDKFSNAEFNIYTSAGQLISETSGSGKEVMLDVTSLKSGVYILQIIQQDRVSSHRLLKY